MGDEEGSDPSASYTFLHLRVGATLRPSDLGTRHQPSPSAGAPRSASPLRCAGVQLVCSLKAPLTRE